jgi:hypothetical protein
MRKLALLAACLLFACCSSEDKIVTQPAHLEVSIDHVSATKVEFSVKCSNPDASYIYRGVSDSEVEDVKYTDSDMAIALQYMENLNMILEYQQTEEGLRSSFQDIFCFKGNRSFKMKHVGSDMRHRILVFQVNPKTHEIVGEPVSAEFETPKVAEIQMDFDLKVEGDILTIIPSDPEQAYYWDYEMATSYSAEPFIGMYNLLYDVTDMLETYGFINQSLSKGTVTFSFSEDNERMVEGMTYLVAAAPYANHELAGLPKLWKFVYHNQ